MKLLASLAITAASFATTSATDGPYAVEHTQLGCANLDSTDANIEVWFPSNSAAAGTSFPLISYNHGYTAGGDALFGGYNALLSELASFGFVVAATRSCSDGCADDTTSLPLDPPGFGHYYYEQYKVIECAASYSRSGTAPFDAVDFSKGVGISGRKCASLLVRTAHANAWLRVPALLQSISPDLHAVSCISPDAR